MLAEWSQRKASSKFASTYKYKQYWRLWPKQGDTKFVSRGRFQEGDQEQQSDGQLHVEQKRHSEPL